MPPDKITKLSETNPPEDPVHEVPTVTGDDHQLSLENREILKPYFDFYDQIRRIIEANPEKFNVDDTYLELFGAVTVRSRTDIGGTEYEVGMSVGRNDDTGLLEEVALISECEHLKQADTQFQRMGRFEALHEVMVRYVQVEADDSSVTPKKYYLEHYIGRIVEPDRGLQDVLIFAKNLTIDKAASLLTKVEEERLELRLINRFSRTYKDYQTKRMRRDRIRTLLE